MADSVVIDTNIFTGALMRGDGGLNRKILEMAFQDDIQPVMGDALYLEYESLLGRDNLYENSAFSVAERSAFFDDFCSICRWVEIHYRWRPNLRDEGDNHVVELALAAGAAAILTWNIKDYRHSDLITDLSILTPADYLRLLKNKSGQ